MDEKYVPSYEITDEMLNLVTQIMENLGKLNSVNEFEKLPRLRRVNRIKTIQSSLAIENNTLSIEQVTDVIDGKRIIGPKEDIIAVQNANLTYKEIKNINPYEINDLLRIHGIMMRDWLKKQVKYELDKLECLMSKERLYIWLHQRSLCQAS